MRRPTRLRAQKNSHLRPVSISQGRLALRMNPLDAS